MARTWSLLVEVLFDDVGSGPVSFYNFSFRELLGTEATLGKVESVYCDGGGSQDKRRSDDENNAQYGQRLPPTVCGTFWWLL